MSRSSSTYDFASSASVNTRRRRIRATRFLLITCGLICLIGTAAIFVDVESVLISGPMLLVSGASLIGFGHRSSHSGVWPIGFSHIAICAFFFFLVWEGQWGPSDAQRPFEIMSLVYTMALLPLTYWALKNSPRVASPWECRRCGYLLFGLTTPRCPECGEAFDPALLEQGSLNP